MIEYIPSTLSSLKAAKDNDYSWRNMKRIIVTIFYVNIILMGLLSPKAEAANWKLYYKNAEIQKGVDCNIYYDMDSVYYPKEKEGLFGKKQDTSFIGLWTKTVCQDGTVMKYHVHLSCQQRQVTLKEIMINDQYAYPPQLNKSYYIESGSTDELLGRIFCK